MQISPRGPGIDTDAKQGPKLLWNNSGISEEGQISGFGKEPCILRRRLGSVVSRDAGNKDEEKATVVH